MKIKKKLLKIRRNSIRICVRKSILHTTCRYHKTIVEDRDTIGEALLKSISIAYKKILSRITIGTVTPEEKT